MFGSSIQIAKIRGIPIRLDSSLLILLAFYLFLSIRANATIGQISVGFLIVALVFASIALHELGHSFVAIWKGCYVRRITLTIIGGMAEMATIPRKAMDEFLMAIAGPAVSLALGIGCIMGGLSLKEETWSTTGAVLGEVGDINLRLAIFNLLPAFPMDGGRVFRAMLTPKLGRLRATRVASTVGRALAILLGYFAFFGLGTWIEERSWMLIAIAFFIYSAAGAECRMVEQDEMLRRQKQGIWPFFGAPIDRPPASPEDEVIISPPPYERGPDRRAEIQPHDDNPFERRF
jgi:Zn-dependent protease